MHSESLPHIFWVCLKLGGTSFGSPAAYLIFCISSLSKEKWLTDDEYSQIMALAQHYGRLYRLIPRYKQSACHLSCMNIRCCIKKYPSFLGYFLKAH
jgi:hypothetical protein